MIAHANQLLALGSFELGGVFLCGVLLAGLFGVPLSLVRSAIADRGTRMRVLRETVLMSWIASTGFLFVVYLLQ